MKNLIKLLSLALILQSCSSGSGGSAGTTSGGGSATSPIPEASSVYSKMVNGVYLRIIDSCISSNNQFYKIQYIKINGEFVEQRVFFQSNACDPSQQIGISSLVSVFVSAKTITNVDGEITSLSTVDLQLLPLDQNVISQWNSDNAYGFHDWNNTTAKSVINKAYAVSGTPAGVSGALIDYTFKSVSNNGSLTFFVNNTQLLKQ